MKKMISLVMCMVMALCMIPTTAMANPTTLLIIGNLKFKDNGNWYNDTSAIADTNGYVKMSDTSWARGSSTSYNLYATITSAGLEITMNNASLTNTVEITNVATATIIIPKNTVNSITSVNEGTSEIYGINATYNNTCLNIQGEGALSIFAICSMKTSPKATYAINSDVTINISGNPTLNIIASTSNVRSAYGIKTGNITINGGVLNIMSGSSGYAYGMFVSNKLHIKAVTSAEIMASGGNSIGIYTNTGTIYVATALDIMAGNEDNEASRTDVEQNEETGVVTPTDVQKKYVTITPKISNSSSNHTIAISSPTNNGEIAASPTSAASGTSVTLAATPTDGYELESVQVVKTDNNASYATLTSSTGLTFTMPNYNVTINATFKEKIAYAVLFDVQGHGMAPASKTNVASGTTISTPTNPTATDYTFDGWYKDASCTNLWKFNTDTVSTNTTLYAKWTAIERTITYEIKTASGSPINDANKYVWTKGSNLGLAFKTEADYLKFKNIVKVDGVVIDSTKYDAESGSTVVTLHKAYLDTLFVGEHTLTLQWTDGEGTCKFTIEKATGYYYNPTATRVQSSKTGDVGPVLYAGLVISSIFGMGYVSKKRED